MQEKKVIFTDLDGSLLDSKYKFKQAKNALEVIKEQDSASELSKKRDVHKADLQVETGICKTCMKYLLLC